MEQTTKVKEFIKNWIYEFTNWDSEGEISSCIAETNACFPDEPENVNITIVANKNTYSFVVHFVLKGEQDQDSFYTGDTIDVTVEGEVITENGEFEISNYYVGASLNKDYLEEYEDE